VVKVTYNAPTKAFDVAHVHFRNAEDRKRFYEAIGEPRKRRGVLWYPAPEHELRERAPKTEPIPPNKYPIYIISKGRWDSRYTAKALDKLGIPYHIVIEPQEWPRYVDVIDDDKILLLNNEVEGRPDDTPWRPAHGQGSIPARNWVWRHARARGFDRHWILDDNLKYFYRLNQSMKIDCYEERSNPFIEAEKFVDRYRNVALAGLQYQWFAPRGEKHKTFCLNTRIYSCILIKNDIPYRWRGRYNEDTDLSLRALKDGWCTVLFYNYLCDKEATMRQTGGNTDELYAGDGRMKMAQSLVDQHPDVTYVTTKWGRPQHQVNYKPFRFNTLKPL
jgi:hypothetical protein